MKSCHQLFIAATAVALAGSLSSAAPTYIFGNVDPETTPLSNTFNGLLNGAYIGAFEDTASNFSGPGYGSKTLWAHLVTFSPATGGQKVGKITIPLTSNSEVRMELFEINGSTTVAASYNSLGHVTLTPETLHTKAWCSFDFASQGIVLDSGKTYGIELQVAQIGSHWGSKLNYWAGLVPAGDTSLIRNVVYVLADRQNTPLDPSTFGTMTVLSGFAPAFSIEASVPEPATLAMIGGLAAMGLRRHRH